MKATIARDDLFDILSAVEQYDKTRTALNVLKFALLKAKGDKISVSATNLETETTVIAPAAIEAEGQILVPIRRIYDLCKSLPDVNIKLAVSKNFKLKLDWGNSATIAIRDVEDFPIITAFDNNDDNIISVGTESLREALPQVTFAAATDESRPILAGVHLTEGMLQSADGFRASFVKLDTLGDVVISATALDEFYKLLCGKEVKIQNSDNGNKIIFKLEDETVFTSNSIQGDFPDIEQLIPETILKLTFDTKQLLAILRQAEVFADKTVGFSTVRANKNGFDIKVQSENDEFEASVLAVEADGDGEIKLGISLKYLSSNKSGVLPRINSEFVEICLRDKSSAIVLKSGNFTHIIMPMDLRQRN